MGLPGSQRTVQQLVDDYHVPLYRYAFRLTGMASEADDLTPEAFCKAQSHLSQLRDPGRAKQWLFSILRNAYLHRIRDARRERCVPLDGVGELVEPLPDPVPEIGPEQLQEA